MKIMNRMLPSCREVSHLTSRAMDESLPLAKRLAMKLHIKMCGWCQRNQEQLLLMKKMAGQKAVEADKKITLGDDAKSRIIRSLKDNS